MKCHPELDAGSFYKTRMKKYQLKIRKFKELTTPELYEILSLRSKIFLVEQDCVYQDLDYKDQEAMHLFYSSNGKVIAYTRFFEPGIYFKEASIGRVVVDFNFRKKGLGHALIQESITAIQRLFSTSKITISAQKYLQNFYKSHGFKQLGQEYLEDGIPHIRMVLI